MINIYEAAIGDELKIAERLKARGADINDRINSETSAIMEDVRKNGWEAVVRYSLQFDGAEPYELTQNDLNTAAELCPKELYAAMEKAADNIRDYQSRLIPKSTFWDVPGGKLGQIARPMTRVGIYAPGGTAAYPSSLLMCAIPAKVAGVEEVILLTPPTENLNNAVLAAAKIAGVDRVIALGGPWAIAAMTYGSGFVPRVDMIAGPGNAWVTAAKRYAYGLVNIESTAGPSDILVIADRTATPAYVAADLISQAEHGELSASILLTDSMDLALQVKSELEIQAPAYERFELIKASFANFGAVVVCQDIDSACLISDFIAPEHLEIMTKEPYELLPKIKNAGAVFMGEMSPEPLGDYIAGPSHVLPTLGTAKFFSPLSVLSFMKYTSLIDYSRAGLEPLMDDIIAFANAEGLTGHAGAVKIRDKR